MKGSINLNVNITVSGDDTAEVSVRHEVGDRDQEVMRMTLPFDPERIAAITMEGVELLLIDAMQRTALSIAEMMENPVLRKAREEMQADIRVGREQGETWVCGRCEFVNVIDDRCARCDAARAP